VLARLAGRPATGRLRGSGRGVAHLDLGGGWIATLAAPGVPRMPNAVVVAAPAVPAAISWDRGDPPAWDPVVPPLPGGRAALAALAGWLAARMPVPRGDPRDAAARLLGRGPGLTPEGDDTLAGAAAAARALGPAAGLGPAAVDALVAALVPADARARTGALSATLLELAAAGALPEPAHRLVAGRGREAALADLRRLGASTGAALAAGIAMTAVYLVGSTPRA
jgi:hypothetical protein